MRQNRATIYMAGFLFYIPIALSSYINSSFMSSFVGEKLVGIVYIFGSICSIFALLLAPKIFKKIGGYRFLLLIILFDAISFLILALTNNTPSIILMFVLGFSMNTLLIFSLDEILKIFSNSSATGKTRGMYMAICNLAWIFAQFASGTFLGGFSFRTIYFISFSVMILLLIISFFKLRTIPDPNYDKMGTLKYMRKFFQSKNLSRAYILSFLIQFFFCWMVIYTPIYLHNYIGFSWKEIGIIFAIMLLPFSIIPFHLGKYADKVGERSLLIIGFTIAGLSTLSLFFINIPVLWIWALFLFLTRVGASAIEIMSDAYFFKHIKPENEEFIGVYRSASPVAYILGPVIASLLIIFIPSFNFIYIILGTILLYGVYLSSKIKKSDV